MSITDYFPYEPTTGQWMAVKMLEAFFENQDRVFVLQGYAGTGKTSLLKAVLDYLDKTRFKYNLMASTGRAARVLAIKTGRSATTIHAAIYQVDERHTILDEKSKTIAFKLRSNTDPEKTIYFVDESSMISDKSETNSELLFDDGRFLDHIFRYAGKRKVIFIGDTAQLPPVNCNFSPALDTGYLLTNYRLNATGICLTEVKRQEDDCGIIHNATLLREKLFSGRIPPLSIDAGSWSDHRVSPNIWVALSQYTRLIAKDGFEHAIFLSYSNKAVHYLNCEIRKNLYKRPDPPLQENEWLMVVHNNSKTGYSNGQHIWLRSFSDHGEKVGNLRLIDAVVEDPETKKQKKVKLIYDLIFRAEPRLTLEEERAFSIDFAIRMRKNNTRPATMDYLFHLMYDERLNALWVKFGYAVTCHKAQGGEWDQVFLNIEPVLERLPVETQYRWFYTAITRATKSLTLPKHAMLY